MTRPMSKPSIQPVPGLDSWCHIQLVYHGDQDLLLRRVVRPLVRDLTERSVIDRFYFVRYELGGPHLRLRFRVPGPTRDLEAGIATLTGHLAERAGPFFAEHPSADPWSEERIREVSRRILGRDPEEEVDEEPVFPDHSWHRTSLGLEVDRYGGPGHIEDALDLFWLASLHVLDVLATVDRQSPSFNTVALVELLRWAHALASDGEEFMTLVDYARRFFGDAFAPCVAEADRQFEAHDDRLARLAASVLQQSATVGSTEARADEPIGDRFLWRLARHARDFAPAPGRWYALASHLHMGANRLGVLNPEEVYLSRLATRAADAAAAREPDLWTSLWPDQTDEEVAA